MKTNEQYYAEYKNFMGRNRPSDYVMTFSEFVEKYGEASTEPVLSGVASPIHY